MASNDHQLNLYSRVLLFWASIALAISIFVPIWRIELAAPQYPEGLSLSIYSNKLGGNVDIINGLNHYIGMKTLHKEDFIEFTVLPYIIGFFALFSLLTILLNRKKLLFVLFGAFVLFGILAMYDFWKWEYNYGHNLNPNAAIIVPGMAYQPPLIGFKQLLNFGAYSIPDTGGWLFIGAGILMLITVLIEKNVLKMKKKTIMPMLILMGMWLVPACGQKGPEPIKLNKEDCAFCKMTIADKRFGAEMVTAKGRVYKFDDMKCMIGYAKENSHSANARYYVSDYSEPHALISVEKLTFLSGGSIESPMAGNIAAFSKKEEADKAEKTLAARKILWAEIFKK